MADNEADFRYRQIQNEEPELRRRGVALGRNDPGDLVLCMDPSRSYFRFVVLVFTCVMSFGNYYCFDMPSVLQNDFQAPRHCPPPPSTPAPDYMDSDNSTACTTGLGMTAQQYNLLYAIYSWTNALVVLFSGFFIDRFGNMVGALVFSCLCLVGSSVFAFGATIEDSNWMMVCMLAGRLLFGAGDGSVTIVQYRMCSMWFKNKELAFAFSMKLVVSRLGSTLNFLLTNRIVSEIGVWQTLFCGAGLCGLGFLSAFCVGFLDRQGMKICNKRKILVSSDHVNEGSTGAGLVQLGHILKLPKLYWLNAGAIVFFYCTLFPFVADSPMFVGDQYGFDNDKASVTAGALYDVSLFFMPVAGALVDYFGFRGFLCSSAQLLTIPVFVIFALDTSIQPLTMFIWYGVTYSLTASVLWACIPLIVDPSIVGTAMGLTSCVQMLGIGTSNMIVGALLGHKTDTNEGTQWEIIMLYFLATTCICCLFCFLLSLSDLCFGNRVLNRGKRVQSVNYTRNIHINSGVDEVDDSVRDSTENSRSSKEALTEQEDTQTFDYANSKVVQLRSDSTYSRLHEQPSENSQGRTIKISENSISTVNEDQEMSA
ncbi:major facilitator superfamily domain-containing protein 1-like isoform X2 [Symsagittifera roscoffensis]|uniref:major facilitator superfamily domain-containing protein 1-like isoform X2 n=1 Tax=Symsagittifera roscoffensis TaxID=84072 RepID=UPI00307B824C